MALVACFCGAFFAVEDGRLGQCPYCEKPAPIPRVSDRDVAEMAGELSTLLDAHSQSGGST